jgi:trk system potassium uptake protein TrkH
MKSKLFGVLLLIEAAALLLTAAVALHYQRVAGDGDARYFLLTAALTGAVGLFLYCIGRMSKPGRLQIRDTFMVVALSWVLFSLFGMLPFLLYGTVDNVTDAFFETMSGFTTTGVTVLSNIDQQPHGILFWRSIMQWLGGLGVVVFTLAFIPSVAKGSKKMSLFAAEAPGLSVEKLAPTMGATSRLLWIIYIVLTLLCAIAYRLGPMNTFDAVCHALTTIATGGFSTHQASIGYFQSSYVQ